MSTSQELRKKEMSDQIAALEAQLKERIEALDKQRKEEAEKFSKEAAERVQLAEAERQRRINEAEEVNKRAEAKKAADKKAEEERLQEERKTQIALENELAAAEEARATQEAKLAWLVQEINKQEFIEEQHRKAMQNATQTVPEVNETNAEINVEYPVPPDNKGNAVQGTTGETPSTPLMSDHLKQILRQAQRSY